MRCDDVAVINVDDPPKPEELVVVVVVVVLVSPPLIPFIALAESARGATALDLEPDFAGLDT